MDLTGGAIPGALLPHGVGHDLAGTRPAFYQSPSVESAVTEDQVDTLPLNRRN